MTKIGEELSDEEVIFERKPDGINKTTSERTPSNSAPSERAVKFEENSSKHAPESWTMTDTPRSTPLMTAPAAVDTKMRDKFWIEDETLEMERLLSPSTDSLLSEMSCELEKASPSVAPLLATRSTSMESKEQIRPPQESRVTFSTAPTPSHESQIKDDSSASAENCSASNSEHSTSSFGVPENLKSAVATETRLPGASNESCKRPVSPVTEVVINIPDEDDLTEVVTPRNERWTQESMYQSGNSGNREDVTKGPINGDMKRDQSGKGLKEEMATDRPANIVINIQEEKDDGLNRELLSSKRNGVVITIGDKEASKQVLAPVNESWTREAIYPNENTQGEKQENINMERKRRSVSRQLGNFTTEVNFLIVPLIHS